MIDLVFGLVFVFFAVASVCSFVTEKISSAFSLRGAMLERALRGMLEPVKGDPRLRVGTAFGGPFKILMPLLDLVRGVSEPVLRMFQRQRRDTPVDALMRHPLIRPLRGKGWFGEHIRMAPSYIPTNVFVTAVKDIAEDNELPFSTEAAGFIRRAAAVGDGPYGGDAIAQWFDATMDRASGWYKRATQFILVAVAIVVVPLFNVDVFAIAQYLWVNGAARAAIVAQATHAAEALPPVPLEPADAGTSSDVGAPSDAGVDAGQPGGTVKTKSDGPTVPARDQALRQAADLLAIKGFPAGLKTWCQEPTLLGATAPAPPPDVSVCAKQGFNAWGHLPGWLLSIIAASFGAPFWFDLLSRISQLRQSGPTPSRKKKGDDDDKDER